MRLAPALVVAVALFAPATATAVPPPFGGLTQLPGAAGCVTGNPLLTQCAPGHAFGADIYTLMALSPDGRNAYLPQDEAGSVLVMSRDAASGALAQTGCVSEDGTGGACSDGIALLGAADVAVSPDGKNVYVAAKASDSVSAFARDPATGALAQLAGLDACTSEDGTGGACVDGIALDGARGVAVSPDGKNVYVTSEGSSAVAIFSRDQTTGALTQLPGMSGCVSDSGTGGQCVNGEALGSARSPAVSPDGTNVYVAAESSQAVAAFTRNGDGGLTQLAGTDACVNNSGGACQQGRAVAQVRHVALSADGNSVYVSSLGAGVAVFSRDRSAGGALRQLAGVAGCITEDGSGGDCTDGVAVDQANTVAVSPDGRSAYLASIDATSAIDTFDRDPATGALTQLAGAAGCISQDARGGACSTGVPVDAATSVVVSPDGKNVYLHAEGVATVDSFARELPPACTDLSHAVLFGAPTVIPLTCSDPNGDPISRTIVTGPPNGALAAVNPNGSVLYTPKVRFRGADSFTFRASDGSLNSNVAVASLGVTPDTIRPKISRASVSPRVFAVRARAAARLKRATTFRYRLSEAAGVLITIQQAKPRRHGRGKRFVKVGRLTQRGVQGANSLRFKGRIGRKKLKPGAYRAVLMATDPAGNHSKPKRLAFRIVRARR